MKQIYIFFLIVVFSSCVLKRDVSILKITYCEFTNGYWQVWMKDFNKNEKVRLTETPVDKRYPVFSADGKKLAYVTNTGKLYIIDLDNKSTQDIALNIKATELSWSPDGRDILFTSYFNVFDENSDIYILHLENLVLKKIVRRPWMQRDPNWSPDKREILFIDAPEILGHEVFRMNLETADAIQLTDNDSYEADPVFSPDSKNILFSSNRDGNYDIWIMDRFGEHSKNLTRHPSKDTSACITKKREEIFFLSDRTQITQVWQMDINGENLVQITHNNADKRDLDIWP